MTEKTTKSPRILLFEAAAIARFDHAKGWPGDFLPGQLAALMAGGWKDEHKKGYLLWKNMIAAAIKAGELVTIEKSKTTEQKPRKVGFVNSWKHQHHDRDPDMLYQPDPVTTSWQEINRTACAAWLDVIAENPSEHVRAWLGPEWKESPGDADTKKSILRAIIAEMQRLDPTIPRGEKPILPGNLLGFHGLCIGKNRPLFYRATSTFDEYRKGLCTFAQKGPPSPSDLAYYQDMATRMGVKWEKPPEAKPRA